MQRRPLKFITREKELELIQRLETLVDSSMFDPQTTCIIMASPDYSATVAMHLAHAWSKYGEILPIVPVDVAYPDEDILSYEQKMLTQVNDIKPYQHLVMIEAGIIRGGNWKWMLDVVSLWGYSRKDVTLVALCENVNSKVKSDYVAEYYDDDKEELMFYFEKFNKHWPIK